MIDRQALVLALAAVLLAAGCIRTSPHRRDVRAIDPGSTRTAELLPMPRTETALSRRLTRAKETAPNPLIRANGEAGVISGRVMGKRDAASAGVAGVMAWLARPPATADAASPTDLQLLLSRGAYRPQVQFANRGSLLQLRTTDDTADFHGSGGLRFSRYLKRGESARVPLPRTGLVVVRSEARPEMTAAYIRVLDHGYHAVTGRDGRFQMPSVPPGEYELLLWYSGGDKGKAVQERVPLKLVADRGALVDWTIGN